MTENPESGYESVRLPVFRIVSVSLPLRCIAGDRNPRTMYPIDRRRIAYKVYTLYCTERGGLHSSIRSVIPQYSDALGTLKETIIRALRQNRIFSKSARCRW